MFPSEIINKTGHWWMSFFTALSRCDGIKDCSGWEDEEFPSCEFTDWQRPPCETFFWLQLWIENLIWCWVDISKALGSWKLTLFLRIYLICVHILYLYIWSGIKWQSWGKTTNLFQLDLIITQLIFKSYYLDREFPAESDGEPVDDLKHRDKAG